MNLEQVYYILRLLALAVLGILAALAFKWAKKLGTPSTRTLSQTIIIAGLYNAIGFVLVSVSFGLIQCRVSDALYPLVGVLGTPALLGTILGHAIYNTYGFATGIALGPLDLILSPLIFILPKLAIWKWGVKATPLHVLAVALWVPWLLNNLFGIPYWPAVVTVGIGEAIAELGLGLPLAVSIQRRLK